MPSFTYLEAFGIRKTRWLLVTFSVKSHGTTRSLCRNRSPRQGSIAETVWSLSWLILGLTFGLLNHDQVLRNHRVGRTCNGAVSGPRFQMLIWMRISSGDCLAYSTKTSKYRSSSTTPVLINSYSNSSLLRLRLVCTISS